MHVVVIGAGVIGVTSAYYLSRLGCRVTVVDRATDVADEASYGNAGQLSYSFTDALAKPEFVKKIPGLVAGFDSAYQVRLRPDLVPWGLRFLSQCTRTRAAENTVAVLKRALRSEKLMQELRDELGLEFSHRTAGKLVLLDSEADAEAARHTAALKEEHGCRTEVVSAQAATEIEPALSDMQQDFVAAVYSEQDSVADSWAFCKGLKQVLSETGRVSFRLGASVRRLVRDGSRITAIELDDGQLSADAFVVCTGAWSGELLRPLGVDPHIYPVRGYSVTLPPGPSAPEVSVTILKRKIVFSRINGRVRIAGFADFLGFSKKDDDDRIATLLEVAEDCAPLAADYEAAEPEAWGGFRPMTPDGRPRVERSDLDGLYLNTGHGMLGWTLACASGHDVAQLVVDPAP